MRFILIAVSVLFVSAGVATPESLCPPGDPLPDGADDLRLRESEFTLGRYESGIAYFDSALPAILREGEALADRVRGSAFWITYRNNLKFVRGYVLRHRASLSTEPAARSKAVAEFCDFISGAKWLD